MKIGLLGGTFNPMHNGHIVLAQECLHKLALDKVIFIPAYLPPHKEVEGDVTASERLDMVRLGIDEDPGLDISTFEIDKKGVSYSIDTIKHLKDEYPSDTEIFFLTGADSAEGISTWKNIDDILSLTTFVIAARPGWRNRSVYEDRIRRINIPLVDVSSSMVRDKVKSSGSIDSMVPEPVARYIYAKKLYAGRG